MNKILFAALVLLGMGMAAGCKKEPLTVRDKIIGHWAYDKNEIQVLPNSPITETLPDEGSYIHINTDGSFKVNFNGSTWEAFWELTNNNTVIQLKNMTNNYVIVKLTTHELIFYFDAKDGNNNTIRETIYLTK